MELEPPRAVLSLQQWHGSVASVLASHLRTEGALILRFKYDKIQQC